MAIITLGGIEYITEAVGDDTIPAHNYDDVIDVSKAEDPDQWFGRVQAEWPNLPDEIKNKVIDSTGQYIGQLSKDIQLQQDNQPADPNKPLEANPSALDEAKDTQGNDMYDFTAGRAKVKGMNDDALAYTRNDLIEVIKAQEDMKKQGHNVPKLGYYWDEYWTVVDEIARRIKAGSQFNLEPWALNGAPVDDKIEELGE
jgi:hypothetical protein